MGGFHKWRYLKMDGLLILMENPQRIWMIWEYPYFRTPPNSTPKIRDSEVSPRTTQWAFSAFSDPVVDGISPPIYIYIYIYIYSIYNVYIYNVCM